MVLRRTRLGDDLDPAPPRTRVFGGVWIIVDPDFLNFRRAKVVVGAWQSVNHNGCASRPDGRRVQQPCQSAHHIPIEHRQIFQVSGTQTYQVEVFTGVRIRLRCITIDSDCLFDVCNGQLQSQRAWSRGPHGDADHSRFEPGIFGPHFVASGHNEIKAEFTFGIGGRAENILFSTGQGDGRSIKDCIARINNCP